MAGSSEKPFGIRLPYLSWFSWNTSEKEWTVLEGARIVHQTNNFLKRAITINHDLEGGLIF